jgi:hypothetical protein
VGAFKKEITENFKRNPGEDWTKQRIQITSND